MTQQATTTAGGKEGAREKRKGINEEQTTRTTAHAEKERLLCEEIVLSSSPVREIDLSSSPQVSKHLEM